MNNEISKNITTGIQLLNEALKQYERGNNSAAYEKYQSAGQYLKEADSRYNTNDGKISMTYGENRNFGAIFHIFEANTKDMLKDKASQQKLKKIMNLIKENAVLKNEFDTYNAFTNPTNVVDIDKYVTEAMSLVKHYPKETLIRENEKLIKVMRECNVNENIQMNDDDTQIYENIEYMMLHPKAFNTINEYAKIQQNLCEYVTANNNIINECKSIDDIYDNVINEFVSKHENLLTEDEVNLIKDVNDEHKAKKLFNEHKSDVIALVREQVEKGVDVDDWNAILDKVSNKVFEAKNALTDIAEFIEIKNEIEG